MNLPHRPRRLRRTPALRRMLSETALSPADFIAPLFIVHGNDISNPIASMPGVAQLSVDRAVAESAKIAALGIPAVLLFGLPATKDAVGQENFADDGIIQQAVRAIKAAVPELVVITDVCLCEYTDHGHCGVLDGEEILNDETLEVLQRVAVSHAAAGADVVAPSGMMDSMVIAIRDALDGDGHEQVCILSYAVKYASGFYGPFRDAADGAPAFGDRRSHQMDPANAREAIREVLLDIDEGADMVMVKPALSYLDVISQTRELCSLPVVAYNVSGEYSMVKAAAASGWLDERTVTMEILTSIKRAGADLIITYHAADACRWLAEN
ncbi:MAG TPA: porphobilinogen synthase [Lentisphaeria bacterium]|nr:porphobilinogen synthase [Lentisphaeria bacterium]